MEEFKKGYAAAHAKFAAYDDGDGVQWEVQGDSETIIEGALCILADVATMTLSSEGLHTLADSLEGLFLQKCIDVIVEAEGGGVFGNDHFKN